MATKKEGAAATENGAAQKGGSGAVTVESGGEAARAYSKAADVPAAKEFDPSGAPRQTPGIDPSHPAIDDNPRAGTTEAQNRIDMNDPTLSGSKAVEQSLKAQSGGQSDEKSAEEAKD